jgi:hypothetical protein
MSITYSNFFAGNLLDNAAPETLYTVPASPATTLLRGGRIRLVNVTAGAVTAKLWVVPLSGTAADANNILPTTSIAANSYIDLDIPIMPAGSFLQGQAGAGNSIGAHMISGSLFA